MTFFGAAGSRWAIAAVALAGAALSLKDASANALARINPEAVLAFSPGDARALSARLDRATLVGTPRQPTPQEARQVREGLKSRPLSSDILRQMATADHIEGLTPRSRKLLNLANRVSRRDALTEILLSNAYARAENAEAALPHFDAALSTTRGADTIMFPVLAQTVALPRFRPLLGEYLTRTWGEDFLQYAVRNARPEHMLELVRNVPAVQTNPRYAQFRSELITRLAIANRPRAALEYAQRVTDDRAAFAGRPGFDKQTTDATFEPLTWRLANAEGIYSNYNGKAVSVSADPASTGLALERYWPLQPGAYLLTITSGAAGVPSRFQANWQLECIGDAAARPLSSFALPVGPELRETLHGFRVGSTCEAVRAALNIANVDDQAVAELQIDRFTLVRAGD